MDTQRDKGLEGKLILIFIIVFIEKELMGGTKAEKQGIKGSQEMG